MLVKYEICIINWLQLVMFISNKQTGNKPQVNLKNNYVDVKSKWKHKI